MLEIEREVQKKWEEGKVFEFDAPQVCADIFTLMLEYSDHVHEGRRGGQRGIQEGKQVFLLFSLSVHERSSSSWPHLHSH